MNSLLNSPLNPISDKPTSHRSSQGVMYGDMLKEGYILACQSSLKSDLTVELDKEQKSL